ncbi:hypothetical protein DESPIGER_0093 [Desulfovibrio piger]|uniref:Uncharacterized protein n=1 Tax=Desulfovibrio piger TaxID=901 RepID=A0A1K1LBA9_9BACT|nr:hypothetical protein DESPIGER_0093 [Desulfovibrio piger]
MPLPRHLPAGGTAARTAAEGAARLPCPCSRPAAPGGIFCNRFPGTRPDLRIFRRP